MARAATGGSRGVRDRTDGMLSRPQGVDPCWQEKVEIAARARRDAQVAREGKPTSFGPISGYSPNGR